MDGGVDPAEGHERIGLQPAPDDLQGADDPQHDGGTPIDAPLGTAPGGASEASAATIHSAIQASDANVAATQDAGEWLGATCPYLRSADGSWRSVVPQRGQRCWGQMPPAPLEPATQERLCRTSAHLGCEIYIAAERKHLDSLVRDHVSPELLDGRFGVLVRPSTLVLDEPVRRVPVPAQVSRTPWTRVGLGLALAAGVVLVALFAGLLGGGSPAASPTVPAIAFATPSPIAPSAAPVTAAPAPSSSAPPPTQAPATPAVTEPPATPKPTPGASPRIRTTYRVKKGDTLAAIADKFGVTKKQLRAVNDFGDPPHLRYGLLINIPYP